MNFIYTQSRYYTFTSRLYQNQIPFFALLFSKTFVALRHGIQFMADISSKHSSGWRRISTGWRCMSVWNRQRILLCCAKAILCQLWHHSKALTQSHPYCIILVILCGTSQVCENKESPRENLGIAEGGSPAVGQGLFTVISEKDQSEGEINIFVFFKLHRNFFFTWGCFCFLCYPLTSGWGGQCWGPGVFWSTSC